MKSFEVRALSGFVWGIISFAINIVYSILLVPFFLSSWGDEKYGLFIGIYAFIQMMRSLDSGHQNYVGNQFNKFHHNDKEKAYKILSSSLLIAFLIGLLELLAFLLFWYFGWIDQILGVDYELETFTLVGVCSMLIMWWLVGSVGGILSRAILAKGLYPQAMKFAVAIRVLEVALIGMSIWLNSDLSVLFILLAGANFIFSLFFFQWIYKQMPEYFPWWKGWVFKTGISNFAKSFILTINGVLEQLSSNGLVLIISNFMTVVFVPVFSTIRTLSNTMSAITNVLVQPLVPELIRFHSQGNKLNVVKLIHAYWFFCGILVNFGFVLLIPITLPLYSFWTNYQLELDITLFYYLVLSVVYYSHGRAITSYLTGINDLKAISILTWTRSAIVLILSLSLIGVLGLNAIGLGIVLSEIVCSLILPFFLIQKHLSLKVTGPRSATDFMRPIFIMTIGFLCLFIFKNYTFFICFIMFLFLIYVYYIEWTKLDKEVKHRLIGMIAKYKGVKY